MKQEATLFFFLRFFHVILYFFVLLLASKRHLVAQDKLTFQRSTIDNGLSQNTVQTLRIN
ncbi:MAG: hypothetical protein FJ218_03970 [Ignavibacteria bacterium]|nr:hypothetical protein [Ignavibacteria bacterium]